jgi:hypothetical protein
MPIGRLGSGLLKRVQALEENFASGYMKLIVTGSSTGFGGTEAPVYVPTTFLVRAAVGNLAKEYDLRDAAQIYNFGDDIFCGEMRVALPGYGVGFYVEYHQLDPNEDWELAFNWFARG